MTCKYAWSSTILSPGVTIRAATTMGLAQHHTCCLMLEVQGGGVHTMELRKQKPGDADKPNLVSGTQMLNLSHTSKGQEVLGIPR